MNLNWDAMVQPNQTVVVYMGLLGIKTLCTKLIEHGKDPDTPIALIQQATTPKQRVAVANLQTMPDIVERSNIKPPTLIVVGEVVALHAKLAWFEPNFADL